MWSMSIGVIQVLFRQLCWWNFMCVLFKVSSRQSHSKLPVSWLFRAFLFHSDVWATGVRIVLSMDASCVSFIIAAPGRDSLGSQDHWHTPQCNSLWSETNLGKHSRSAICYFSDTENMVLIFLKFFFNLEKKRVIWLYLLLKVFWDLNKTIWNWTNIIFYSAWTLTVIKLTAILLFTVIMLQVFPFLLIYILRSLCVSIVCP